MNALIQTGAYVFLREYQRYALADIYAVGGIRIVRFAGDPLVIPGGHRATQRPTHVLTLGVGDYAWWQADGIAVVEEHALTEPEPW